MIIKEKEDLSPMGDYSILIRIRMFLMKPPNIEFVRKPINIDYLRSCFGGLYKTETLLYKQEINFHAYIKNPVDIRKELISFLHAEAICRDGPGGLDHLISLNLTYNIPYHVILKLGLPITTEVKEEEAREHFWLHKTGLYEGEAHLSNIFIQKDVVPNINMKNLQEVLDK